ncbi:MAG TPA: UDP-N-acetylmuramoyl-L-alanyl-D-glutamate--2,6-diaminopimelate ligase [Thermoanaerobaculia bacterium]|nr:UDP-N-acetylmuramoyl-L-alanyl-D-glutamate--2,6-diaminopimelate ligase [Thermoanaerobaculia bacterium]
MRFRELLRGVDLLAMSGDLDADVSSLTADSRVVTPGALFVSVPSLRKGAEDRGPEYIDSAVRGGAVAVVAESAPQQGVAFAQVADSRRALAHVAAAFYGNPAEKLSLTGVTGTSGKTTTTRMIESIFDATGEPAGLIGTIEYRAGDERLVADRTTPEANVVQEWLARMVRLGVTRAVMEVSSHALVLHRVLGIRFAAAVFTNLSQDHFDFHRDFEDYFAAKRTLFDQIDRSRQTAVVNIDDSWGRRLASELGSAVLSFGRGEEAVVRPTADFEVSVRGLRGSVQTPAGVVRLESPLVGLPNLYNWLGAIGAAVVLGIPIGVIERGIRDLASVPGRFERVDAGDGPTVIVDYAHKPDALEKLLLAVRELAGRRRIVLIVGCGGDRDRQKRPMMGAIAARLADETILTSDNPRGEDPEAILDEIEKGMAGSDPSRYRRIADRRRAISEAIAAADEDTVVVIAGKGHETYQVIGDRVVHFDDREEAGLALKMRHEKAARI